MTIVWMIYNKCQTQNGCIRLALLTVRSEHCDDLFKEIVCFNNKGRHLSAPTVVKSSLSASSSVRSPTVTSPPARNTRIG